MTFHYFSLGRSRVRNPAAHWARMVAMAAQPADSTPAARSIRAERARRRSTAGEATREKLMVSAERLFALHGVAGASLREIQDDAGQSNASVIAYHFGSRHGLVRALLTFRYEKIN